MPRHGENLGTGRGIRAVAIVFSVAVTTVAVMRSRIYLLRELVRRDFSARFMGSALGLAWAVIQPLSLVALYWFVFTMMIPRNPLFGTGSDYVLFLIAGLLPWIGLSEGIARGATSLSENGAMVRRLAFQSEMLVIVPNVSAMIFEAIGLALFLVFLVGSGGTLRGLWLLPVAMLLQFLLQVGVSWILATMNVFFRDVVQILGFVLSILFYLSPILYPVRGGRYEEWFAWNPLTPLLGLFRSAILGDPLPSAGSLVFLLFVTFAVCGGGLMFYRRAQPSVVDLL